LTVVVLPKLTLRTTLLTLPQQIIMSQSTHSYGPTCYLARSVSSKDSDDVPNIKAQFFYYSPLPIDDPLSALPAPAGSESKSAKHPPRPFSAYDNNALEEAWLGLASKKDKKRHTKSKASQHVGKAADAGPTPLTTASSGNRNRNENSERGLNIVSAISTSKAVSKSDQLSSTSPAKYTSARIGTTHMMSVKPPETRNKNASVDNLGPDQPKSNLKSLRFADRSTKQSSAFDPLKDPEHLKVVEDLSQTKKDGASGSGNSPPRRSHYHPCCSIAGEASGPSGSQDQADDNKPEKLTKGHSKGKLASSRQTAATSQGDDATDDGIAENLIDVDSNEQHPEREPFNVNLDFEGYPQFSIDGHNSVSHGAEVNLNRVKSSPTQNPQSFDMKDATISSVESASTSLPNQANDTGTTGFPFLKFTSRDGSGQSQIPQQSAHGDVENLVLMDGEPLSRSENSQRPQDRDSTESEPLTLSACKAQQHTKELADVLVGVSRLHLVQLPALQMKPIYWSPVHDVAAVTRGTWFYKDTMYPVEPPVANQLEMGYRELRPWSQTWSDELNSAIDVGAAGEEKIAHRLWPKEDDLKSSLSKMAEYSLSTDPYCAAKCFHGEAAAEGNADPDGLDGKPSDVKTISKKYPNAQIIYKDSRNAFILKPNLQPSAYYGRKPLQKVKRGVVVGIHVVRGFDWKAWEKLHPSKKTHVSSKLEGQAPVSGNADAVKGNTCSVCRSQEERENVTDLILVIHGIGQKLSERVESFHFTHAINSFRRSVNVELSNESVKRVLRDDLGRVMVLPVNWRSNLSFEEGGPMKDGDKDRSNSEFSLKDITPDTIPAVRNLISDVMLDIPFYMSHHKPKMIQAVISEANRVYRLWCKNNPEFHKEGRVHIIAHSLGSAMAVEVLSNQPTSVPRLDLDGKKINTKYFDFNTSNLFFVGSPAGFFLLLDKGKLVPRKDQNKPGAEPGDDLDKSIVSDAGTFGCLAVDNVYNIMHYNDPIAYRLNATVDPQYAKSLKNAQVPSATTGFFEGIGNAMRSITPGVAAPVDLAVGQMKPSVARLPSQLEMEVHDFTREEIAEKKFFLLNDNGQVDWFLSSGGGPLEIQYINMLGAHSSYWGSADFIRMIVTEVGRKPGKRHTLSYMRAMKVGRKR
jgi:hypothetical protein